MPDTVGEAVATRLIGDAPVGALIGDRIYPSKPTQEPSEDYLVYFGQSGGDGVTLDGSTEYHWYEVRVEATSRTQAGAEAIMAAVRTALHGWRDVSQGVQGSFAQSDADEITLEDGRQVSGQTFSVRFKPV